MPPEGYSGSLVEVFPMGSEPSPHFSPPRKKPLLKPENGRWQEREQPRRATVRRACSVYGGKIAFVPLAEQSIAAGGETEPTIEAALSQQRNGNA
jgi:hypothetical protein